MSLPTPAPPTEPEPYKRPDVGSALLILVGVVLLLPGLCAIFSVFTMGPMVWRDAAIVPLGLLWAFCILISYGGLRLIVRSSQGSRG